MKLALLGAKIGPNLFAVIPTTPPDWPPSSCVSGTPKALSHPATRGASHAARKPVPAPKASVAEDFPLKLVGVIKISVCYVALPVKTWCFKSHLCSKLHVDTTSLLSMVCVCYLWGFLRVFWKLMDKEERLQYYNLRGQCWALCCQPFKPDQQHQRKYFCKSSSFLCRWNIMSMIYHYQKDHFPKSSLLWFFGLA